MYIHTHTIITCPPSVLDAIRAAAPSRPRRRCSAGRLIKRRRGAQRRSLAGVDWLLAGHVTSTPAVRPQEWTTGEMGPRKGVASRSVGWSGAKRRGTAAVAAAAAADRAQAGVRTWVRWGGGRNTAHSLSCFYWRATPCPFCVTKGGYHGIN